jgi:heme A synthase
MNTLLFLFSLLATVNLVHIIIILIVTAIVLYIINRKAVLGPETRKWLNIAIVVVLVIWLFWLLGVFNWASNVQV